jgi:hypothetical protein
MTLAGTTKCTHFQFILMCMVSKVHKREIFYGSDFEFCTFGILEKLLTNIKGSTLIEKNFA